MAYIYLAGRPLSESHTTVIEGATAAVEHATEQMSFRSHQKESRRGKFRATDSGVSSGTGNVRPHMLKMYSDQAPVLQELFQNKDMLRISAYVNSAFKGFAPDLHDLYRDELKAVMDKDKSLRPPFLGSVFACAAINFPPDVVAIPHRDHLNLAYGWCSITPLGHFDHKVGAHLVLPELELAIQFPVGSTIFIPSAAFTHYNTTFQEGETRSSITQFSAGGIFRWTAYGHQLKREAEAACVQGKKWWEKGKGLDEFVSCLDSKLNCHWTNDFLLLRKSRWPSG
ncbi:hypothetical protein BJ322DRAFT_1115154 [Thelephora terrestris]|uniref:Uncharacterized protein n=1 Tax=Thelephora terrestris TaxID=56493 RepID=A0A9P6H172_9AGAM|nr:hypothetical protein BJ322DRAFT_1115154 [Thelephora terrestris]